jgi:glycerol-3-phosphate dehydrogenase subunit B
MWNGVIAWRHKRACLIVDFDGLKGFSARQIQSVLKNKWPALRITRITLPDQNAELYPERLSQTLELPAARERLAAMVLPLLKNAKALGFPAIFGIYNTMEVMADLQKKIGIPVFEVPTLPPAVNGLRLKNAFEKILPALGVQTLYQKILTRVKINEKGSFVFNVADNQKELVIEAQAAILATGRFIGQGLAADRQRIRETLFDLPVTQPASRTKWHRERLLDPRGHGINKAGLEINDNFQPLTATGRPAYQNLYIAGSILAHADWIRMKCGSGLAIATAHAAVNAYLRNR